MIWNLENTTPLWSHVTQQLLNFFLPICHIFLHWSCVTIFCWQARDTECCCLCLVVVFVSKLSLSISCFNSGNLTALNWQLNVCLFWFTVISWHFEIGQGMVRSACNMLWVFVTTCRMISISIHLNSVAGLFSRNYLSLLPTAGHILDIYRRNGCLLSTFWSHIIDRMY